MIRPVSPTPLDLQRAAPPADPRRAELAYILPMAAFMLFTWLGGHWPSFYAPSYALKSFLTAFLIVFFWKHYTRIRWDYWWLGLIVGVLGIVQWVGMEELLVNFWPHYPRIPGASAPFNPFEMDPAGKLVHFSSPLTMWSFILVRWAGAALVVPFMEELFWRDFLWRTVHAPNDFRLARIGEWDPKAIAIVLVFFASVHPQWMTAIVWGAMIAGLLLYTRSLGACIIAHAVTNLLLGAYVQWTHKWYYW